VLNNNGGRQRSQGYRQAPAANHSSYTIKPKTINPVHLDHIKENKAGVVLKSVRTVIAYMEEAT